MSSLLIQLIPHNSPAYRDTILLRHKVLRAPLGLSFSAEELLAEKDHLHIATYIEGRLVGCLILVPLDDSTLKMRQVAVEPAEQGQGIGTRLVAYAEQLAIEKGYSRIELNARETAVRFYLDLAYEKTGDPFEEVGLPHVKMVKDWGEF